MAEADPRERIVSTLASWGVVAGDAFSERDIQDLADDILRRLRESDEMIGRAAKALMFMTEDDVTAVAAEPYKAAKFVLAAAFDQLSKGSESAS